MKRIILLALVLCLTGFMTANAQDNARTLPLDATLNDSVVSGPDGGLSITDDGGLTGPYSGGYDYHVTILGNCPADSNNELNVLYIELDPNNFDIAETDTLYIYDGPTVNSPLIVKINNNYQHNVTWRFYIGNNNTTGMMTIRFRTKQRSDSHGGFNIIVECGKPCEHVTPVIESQFEHIDIHTHEVLARLTERPFPTQFDSIFQKDTVLRYDTVWTDSTHREIARLVNPHDTVVNGALIRVDTLGFSRGITNCIGQAVQLHGHGEYTNNLGYYTPNDRTSRFVWYIKQSGDSIWGTGLTTAILDDETFQNTGCADIILTITDVNGCRSTEYVTVQVRMAQNPIKTLFALTPICNTKYQPVTVGVNDNNSTLNLKQISFEQTFSQTNAVRTFIPDGPICGSTIADKCYVAPVTFDCFGGKYVTSAADVCSICINYEHTYMGDYRIALLCPTYDENNPAAGGIAVLKYGKSNDSGNCGTCDPLAPADSPDGGDRRSPGGGSYEDTGVAPHTDSGCDSVNNPFGLGLDYCWSRNSNYILITGDQANVPTRFQAGDWYISHSGPNSTIRISDTNMPVMQMPPFTRPGGGTMSVTTRTPSNHDEKTNYYSPSSDFSELIGCPMDGEWKVQICDFWQGDNGWIFSWTLDFCGQSSGNGSCIYQVGIDSVTWRPDTNYATDFRNGEYKGLHITDIDSSTAHITSPDTSGIFPIRLKIYDEFGCIWDTNTSITTVHVPQPNLGEDITLCSSDSIQLNAYDGYRGFNYNYTYKWVPYGQEDPQIYTSKANYGSTNYIVAVRNTYRNPLGGNLVCDGRDTIRVTINEQPILSFDPGIYPLEGCEPFTLNVSNTTKYGYKYRWEFGDGVITTQKEPVHSYGAGLYTLKYYVESEKGCKDSLILDSLVSVFPNPTASFSWNPEFPTVTRPQLQLINNSTPMVPENKFFWEVQYNRDHPNSFATLRETNPTYTWTSKTGEDVTGAYTIRLISRTDNYGPSGNLVQCADTSESTILIINDNIIFPSVVTPNGDGINDRFVIQNLVEGLGYQINSLDIYDKWGSRVFHAENITSDDQFWDPATTNSPTGTYFYRFIGRGQAGTIERNGVIEVLR